MIPMPLSQIEKICLLNKEDQCIYLAELEAKGFFVCLKNTHLNKIIEKEAHTFDKALQNVDKKNKLPMKINCPGFNTTAF